MRRAAVAVLLISACTGGCGGDTAVPRPNLLLITLDTVRADRLGAYGHAGAVTPEIDRLAAEGVVFAHAVAPAPTTLPSHATIFTGLTPPRHGVRDNAAGGLPESAWTMAEAFRNAGYDTGAFVGAYVLDADRGLAQGFDEYAGVPLAPGAAPTSLAEAELPGDRVVTAALSWIEKRAGEPWFAWVHLFDAHAPYRPPPPFAERFADRPYDGEIAWLDSLVGRLRTALEETGEWPDTNVVLTADHGESLGEHGEPTHGFFVYDATIRVPLIVRPAAFGPPVEGSDGWVADYVAPTAVGLVDLLPTIAEMHTIDAGTDAEGRSLLPALRGAALEDRAIYSETLYPRLQFGWHELRAVTLAGEKLIEAPTVELYRLDADPTELDNLAGDAPERVAEIRAALAPWIALDRERAAAGALSTDPARLAALRALGYLAVARAPDDAADLPDPKDKVATFRVITEAMGSWRNGDTPAALETIDDLIAAEPDFAGAWHFRGLILAGAGRPDEAAAAYETALRLDPGHELAARALVRTWLGLGRTDEALGLLAALLVEAPDDVEIRWELGRLTAAHGRPDDAAALLQEGLDRQPDAAKLHLGLGLTDLQRGEAAAALRSFQEAARLDPGLPGVHFQRGLALERLDRTEEALGAYTDQGERTPRHFGAHFNRALLLSRAGRNAELIGALEAALAARPESPEAMLFLAQALLESDDGSHLERARGLAERGLELAEPPQLRILGHGTLAEIYTVLGRDDDARRQREAATRLEQGPAPRRSIGGR